MAEGAAEGTGGSVVDRLKKFLLGIYLKLEDGYYAVMDALDGAGVPVYKYWVDPIESRGVPSFPVTVLVLLAILALLLFTFGGFGQTADFEVAVFKDGARVSDAVVEVYDGDVMLATANTVDGSAVFVGMPLKQLEFRAHKDDLKGNAFFDTARRRGRIDLVTLTTGRPPSAGGTPNTVSPPPGGGFTNVTFCDDDGTCDHQIIVPGGNHSGQKGAVIAVLRDSKTGTVIASRASAQLIDASSLRQLASSVAVNGTSVFAGIAYGTRFFAKANATGYFEYDGYGLGLTYQIMSPSRTITLLLDPATANASANVTIVVKQRGGGPLSGVRLQLYRGDAQLPLSEEVINGSRTYVLRLGDSYRAVASKDGYNRGTQAFTAQTGTITIELDATGSNNSVVPATISINVTRATPTGVRAVSGAAVTIRLKQDNLSALCASDDTGTDGVVEFSSCTTLLGEPLFDLLTGDVLNITANYYLGDQTPLLHGGPVVFELTAGQNNTDFSLNLPVVPESGTVNASVYDAITLGVTPDLDRGRLRLVCQEPLYFAEGRFDYFAASSCTGSHCMLPAPWIVDCRLFATAPNYFNSSDIVVPWIEQPGQVVSVSTAMIPTSFNGSSIMTLDGVFDWQGRPVAQGGELVKSFDYNAKFTLRSFNATDEGAGAFMQAGATDGDCSTAGACFFNHSAFPNLQLQSFGYTSIEDSCTAYNSLDYGIGNAYRALDLVSINNINGQPYAGQFFTSFRTNEDAASNGFSMHWRSYVQSANKTAYDPYDSDVLFNGKLDCHANNYSESFTLASSQKSCSPDNSVCVTTTFAQDTNPDNGRGDGFTAFSTKRCFEGNGTNQDACTPLQVVFTIEDSRSNQVRRPYAFSFKSNYSSVRPEKVVFTKVGADNVHIEVTPQFIVDQYGFVNFTIDADALLFAGRNKPPAAIVQGYVIAQPWELSPEAPVSIGYSAASQHGLRNSWVVVAYNERAIDQFGLLQWELPGFTQTEQVGFERLGNGSYVVRAPFDRHEVLPALDDGIEGGPIAALDDCSANFPADISSWNCTASSINFSFEAFQPYAAPMVVFNSSSKIPVLSLSYLVLDAQGALKASGFGQVSSNGLSAVASLDATAVGDHVIATAFLSPRNATTTNEKAGFNASFVNGPANEGGALAVSSFIRVAPAYGVVKFEPRDAFTDAPIGGALVNLTYLDAVSYGCRLDGDPRACTFRMRYFEGDLPDAFNATATASGYFDSPALPFSSNIVVKGTTLATRTIAAVPLIPSSTSNPNSTVVTLVYRLTDLTDARVVCSASGSPFCNDTSIFLDKNHTYKATLHSAFRNAEKVGFAATLAPFDGTAYFYNASRKMASMDLSLTIGNITGGDNLDSCAEQYYTPANFFANVHFDSQGKPENGFNWMDAYAVTNGANTSGKAFSSDVYFFVPSGTDAANITLGYRAFAASYRDGSERYLRYPHDAVLGTERSNSNRDYCQAEQAAYSFKLKNEGASCTTQACAKFEHFSQFTPQGSVSENDGQAGFDAISKPEWIRWAGEFPPEFRTPRPLNVSFAIDLLEPLPDGKITFTIDPAHLEFKSATFSVYCGSSNNAKVNHPITGSGTKMTIDVSDCPDFAAPRDFVGELELWPTALTTTQDVAEISMGVDSGSTSVLVTGSSVDVISPVTASDTAIIQTPADARQRHPNENQPCGDDHSYTCGIDNLFFTVNSCVAGGDFTNVENTYRKQSWGLPELTCPDSYVELKHVITSRVAASGATLTFNLTGPSADFIMRAYVDRAGRTTYPYDASQHKRDIAIDLGNVQSGEQMALTVLVAPMATGKITGNVTIYNGGRLSHSTVLPYVENRSVPDLPPDIGPNSLFCGGNAALVFRIEQDGRGQPQPVSGCNNMTMVVDNIFPADAVPMELDTSFKSICGDVLAQELVQFSPVAGHPFVGDYLYYRNIGGTPVVIVNALKTPSLLKGNNFYLPDDLQRKAASGYVELGRVNMTVACGGTGKKASVVLIIKKQDLQGVNALDASYIFGKGQSHQAAYTLYNGQYPANAPDLAVKAAGNQPSDVRKSITYAPDLDWNDEDPDAPNARLNYWLMSAGTGGPGTDSQNTYPLKFYPGGGSQTDGVTVTIPDELNAYRPGSWLSILVGRVHAAESTNHLYQQFTNHANGDPENIARYTCEATAYVSDVMSKVPAMFKSSVKDVAAMSVFRRSPLAMSNWLCGTRRDTNEISCYPSMVLWINTTIVQQFANVSCRSCADVSGGVDVSYNPDSNFGISITPENQKTLASVQFYDIHEENSFTLSNYSEGVSSMKLEFKKRGSTSCPIATGNSQWCDGSGDKFLGTYDANQLSFNNATWTWSKQFNVDPSGTTDGVWAVRLKSTKAGGDAYSVPLKITITRKSLSCHPQDAQGSTCGLPRCDPDCNAGFKRVVTQAGPLDPSDPNYWLNITPLEQYSLQNVHNIENYWGAPYKYLVNTYFNGPRDFSMSLPISTWGWNIDQLTALPPDGLGFTPETSEMCGVGIGLYELKASSADGKSFSYSVALKQLPTSQYLLGNEPSDTATSSGTLSVKQVGCSIKTEYGGGSINVKNAAGQTVGSRIVENNKWLCNIKQVSVEEHSHSCGEDGHPGVCDCVQYCATAYCGNCGGSGDSLIFCPIAPQYIDDNTAANDVIECPIPTTPPQGYSGYCFGQASNSVYGDYCEAPMDESIRVNN
jgi:hypothetical protein